MQLLPASAVLFPKMEAKGELKEQEEPELGKIPYGGFPKLGVPSYWGFP